MIGAHDPTPIDWTITSVGGRETYRFTGRPLVAAIALAIVPGGHLAKPAGAMPLDDDKEIPPHANADMCDDWFCETFGAPYAECLDVVLHTLRPQLVACLQSVEFIHDLEAPPRRKAARLVGVMRATAQALQKPVRDG